MNQDFVKYNGNNEHGSRILTICGKEYIAHEHDRYIDEAIALAKSWPAEQRNFERIFHLRTWIRENMQHGHNIDYTKAKSIQDCKEFIDAVIHAEYEGIAESSMERKEDYLGSLNENKQIFSSNRTLKQVPKRRLRF